MASPLSSNLDWALANPLWSQALNPVLSNAVIQGKQISNISLVANKPLTINHGLNKMMSGWFVVDNTANCNLWRTQPFNSINLTLESSANTTVSVWVY